MSGRVVLDEGAVHNRTSYVVDDSPEHDPLNLAATPAHQQEVQEEQPNPVPEQQQQVQESGNEAQVEQEQTPVPEIDEQYYSNLNNVFQAKAGVTFDQAIEILAELAQWKLDIQAAEMQRQAQPQVMPQQQAPQVPAFQRSQGRQPSPGVNAYDYKKSDIARMTRQEYEEKAQDITRAYMAGRVLNDMR